MKNMNRTAHVASPSKARHELEIQVLQAPAHTESLVLELLLAQLAAPCSGTPLQKSFASAPVVLCFRATSLGLPPSSAASRMLLCMRRSNKATLVDIVRLGPNRGRITLVKFNMGRVITLTVY